MPSTAINAADRNNNLPTGERDAHRAMARLVEAQGDAIARELYDAHIKFNLEYFEGRLLPAFVEVTTPGSQRALADYRWRTVEGVDSHIRVAPRVVKKGLRYALDILLHEMVHAYCAEVLGIDNTNKTERSYGFHGPIFTAQCNRIGRELGLPEVFAKGRGGPSSAQWPINVRPAGYYGDEPSEESGGEGGEGGEGEGAGKGEEKAADPFAAVRRKLCKVINTADAATLDLISLMLHEVWNKGEGEEG